MVNVYDLNAIPYILKHFKVNNIIINDLSDKKIIEQILSYDAEITTISFKNDHGFDLEIIKEFSLNVLPTLKDYDAIFINDDPNWYTVFNQLNIIKDTNDVFPLVFICNDRFPYKRRDAYSNPNNIPEEFRHEFSKSLPLNFQGEDIFIQDNYYHATVENNDKNGVSTAIEDFLHDNSMVSRMDIQFIEEITILCPRTTISKIRMDKIMNDIADKKIDDIDLSSINIENQILLSYIYKNNISIDNLEEFGKLKIKISEKNELINGFEKKIKDYDNEIEYKNSMIGGVQSQLSLKDSQIKNLESKLFNKDVEIEDLNNKIIHLGEDLNEEELKHEKSNATIQNKINDRINVIEGVFNSFENQIDDLIENNEDMSDKLKFSGKKIKDNQRLLNLLKNENHRLNARLDSNKYYMSCFEDEIYKNRIEIQYMKNNRFIKSILSPLSYFVLLIKSSPKEFMLNIKLYKSLKNSKCFDLGYYLKNNNDIFKSKWCNYFSPELHYVCNGFKENRKFNKKFFNTNSKKELLNYLLKYEKL